MKKIVIPCIIALLGTGCATQNYLTEQEIVSRYDQVASLQQAFTLAEASDVKLLAPTLYTKAKKSLDESMELAKVGDEEANEIAGQGLKTLQTAQKKADKSRDLLESVLAAKQKAEEVGAANSLADEYQDANEQLLELTKMVEEGEYADVREDRGALERTYRNLELQAMKKDIVQSAKDAIETAQANDAKKLAPKTFQQAEEEMRLALNIIEVNRGASAEAESYAERAKWWAERANSISETVKNFRQSKYTDEEIVLWHQDQLASILSPMNNELPVNMDSKRLNAAMRADLEQVIAEREQLAVDNESLLSQSKNMAESGRQQKAEMEKTLTQTREQASEADRRFEAVQQLFEESEAVVFRKKNEVLLRTSGFDFGSGQSEIDSTNFALLQKIIRAIDNYPGAAITVAGHTDATGDAMYNKQLSEKRAQKVAEFLIKVGQIDPARVKYEGYGENKPIASNETKSGRAENRRVEINLVN